MRSTPSKPSLPCPLWPGVVAPDMVLSIGQIELLLHLTACKQKMCTYVKLNFCNRNVSTIKLFTYAKLNRTKL